MAWRNQVTKQDYFRKWQFDRIFESLLEEERDRGIAFVKAASITCDINYNRAKILHPEILQALKNRYELNKVDRALQRRHASSIGVFQRRMVI